MLEKRVAYHHSGLGYALRAGLVEPLAKAGQLRVVVSTMGLAAGINFSVRSVHVSSTTFHDGVTEQSLTQDDLLQMFGRAGRRGMDERGYIITSRDSPTLADARAARLRRGNRLSWPLFLRVMRRAALEGSDPFAAALEFAQKLFSKSPPDLGLDVSESFTPGGATAAALFGLKATRRVLFNSAGVWEEHSRPEPQMKPLSDAWLALEGYRGPALGSAPFVNTLAPGLGRVCKLTRVDGVQLYGKEIALGAVTPQGDIIPTHALRRLLRIPRDIEVVSLDKIQNLALPRLAKLFEGGALDRTSDKENLRWAQFDFLFKDVQCLRDSHGKWIAQPLLRSVERTVETEIQREGESTGRSARSGTPVHSWRSLGLIEADGKPTRRGVIFSFFQHGEGLAIAAALEDESYPLDELTLHLANLRSDCHFEMPEPGGSERLAAVCRSTYGFVNHPGFLEAGLPLGYGEGTAELLGLSETSHTLFQALRTEVSAGDLSRAYIEWLSLLRHITHAPAFEWQRWSALRENARVLLANHLVTAHAALHPTLPPLTARQKHERPRHWVRKV